MEEKINVLIFILLIIFTGTLFALFLQPSKACKEMIRA